MVDSKFSSIFARGNVEDKNLADEHFPILHTRPQVQNIKSQLSNFNILGLSQLEPEINNENTKNILLPYVKKRTGNRNLLLNKDGLTISPKHGPFNDYICKSKYKQNLKRQ